MPKNCPVCGSAHTRVARMYSSDGLLRRLFYSPRRCRGCRHRFWQANRAKQGLFAVLLVGAAGLGGWQTLGINPVSPVDDRASIIDRLRQRALDGDPQAQYELGMRYMDGNGIPSNVVEATRFITLAAKAGYLDAEYQHGLSLLQGRGVVQDYRAAFNWIEQAARRGHTQSQAKLGEMYRYGNGLPQDKARAYLWFNLAAAQGDSLAALSRDAMANQIAPEDLVMIQSEARKLSEALLQGQELPATVPILNRPSPQTASPPEAKATQSAKP